jgi:hypothetical protein
LKQATATVMAKRRKKARATTPVKRKIPVKGNAPPRVMGTLMVLSRKTKGLA